MCSLIFVYFNNYNQMYSLSVMASVEVTTVKTVVKGDRQKTEFIFGSGDDFALIPSTSLEEN